jgi:TetR/AcrR family transcriptional regulator, cholesterol catabolism regulator
MPSPPDRPALRNRYDVRRQAVIDASARAFATNGFHATSIKELVEATGLKAGGLYHYIGSKDELLVQICDDLMEPLLDTVREIAASDDPARVQLRRIMHTWIEHLERKRDHMLVFQQERHVLAHGPQWQHVRRQRKEFEELLGEIFARGQMNGEFQLADRDLSLRALLGMVNQLPQWFRRDGRLSAAEIADGYLAIVLGADARCRSSSRQTHSTSR